MASLGRFLVIWTCGGTLFPIFRIADVWALALDRLNRAVPSEATVRAESDGTPSFGLFESVFLNESLSATGEMVIRYIPAP